MKTVYTNSEIAHLWANHVQSTARNSQRKIPAYNREGGYVLFTNRSSSVTTAKHVSLVRCALRHRSIIWVNNPLCKYDDEFSCEVSALLEEIHTLSGKIFRARSNRELYQRQQAAAIDNLNTFLANVCKNTLPPLSTESYGLYALYVLNSNPADIAAQVEALKKAETEKAKAKAKAERIERRKMLAKWRKHTYASSYLADPQGKGYAYLRLSRERDRIETSQGASVSVRSARIVAAMIDSERPIHGHTLDGYTITSWNGELKIGCHIIPRREVLKIKALIS